MKGRVHSLESFGTVDGPGVRFVVFLQGCPMRCAYCHNPDTWELNGGKEMDAAEIMNQYERNRGFYREGGITVTGGEPLLQVEFITELFKLAKEKDIHTCIDTSGITYRKNNLEYTKKLDLLMEYTDLIMLDIKHIDPIKHKELTEQPNDGILEFASYLEQKQIPTWIRHVVVPGLTDDPTYLYQLGYFIGQFKNIKALDVLPYHTMGINKYEQLGMTYKLEGVKDMNKSDIPGLKQHIIDGIKDRRNGK